ncbi:hypothetical protein VTN31DRAFT_2765 [Thermomyces dupontii]|uniref:uncharacterized protein n=1 Tax=Talaromyces thermophilus TaxID=28565 RepID=UPI0037446105
MQIKQLFVYPIKSLRGCSLQETVLTRSGFPYDRCFMLLKVETDDQGNRKPRNMHVPHFPEMALFLTDLVLPNSEDPNGKIIVTYQIPPVSEKKGTRTLEVPLQPDVDGLEELELTMHRSSTTGYNMGSRYNDWFSECFGYPVILAYIGQNRRRVLGSMAPSAQNDANGGFLSSIIPFLGKKADDDTVLTFADCAAYLVVSETSVNDVSSRLDDGYEMDVTKFRPNIVVSGAERPWEEDFWGEIAVGESGARIALTSNCVRCVSINVSYETGTHGKTENEQVYKKLTKDRRVDKGAKYNPVFGRYGFLNGNGIVPIRVGDSVEVTRTLNERTTFDWPGLASSSR